MPERSVSATLNGRPERFSQFVEALEEWYGWAAYQANAQDARLFHFACPACRSHGAEELHDRLPLDVQVLDGGAYRMHARCTCSWEEIFAALKAGPLTNGAKSSNPANTPEIEITTEAGELEILTASRVTPETVRWFWSGWLPLRAVSLLAGLPGLGKTTLAVKVVADATRGELEGALHGTPVHVLFATLEDSIRHTIVPRLMAAGADLDRVHFIGARAVGDVLDLTRHMGELDQAAERYGARLLIVDPLVATLPAGKVSSHRDQDVRSVLAPLAGIADQRDLAVLAAMHFHKSATDALLGVGGSIGFVGAARSVLIFGADPHDERGEEGPARVLAHRKSNLGKRQRSRACWIQPRVIDTDDGRSIETSVAILGDEVDVDADDLVQVRERKDSPRIEAAKFLRQLLADGPHAAKEIQDLAEDRGLAWRTVNRAKADLGNVKAFQQDRAWWWCLEGDGEPPEQEELS